MAKKRSNSTASASSAASAHSTAASSKNEDDDDEVEEEENEVAGTRSDGDEEEDDDVSENNDDDNEVVDTKNEASASNVPPTIVEKIPNNNKTMKNTLVGGPLLGSRRRTLEADVLSWKQFEPVVSPSMTAISRRGNYKQGSTQRVILLPHNHHISVLAYKTGMHIGTLIPLSEKEEEEEEERRKEAETNQKDGGKDQKKKKRETPIQFRVAIECVSIVTIPRRNKQQQKRSVQEVLNQMKDDNGEDDVMQQVDDEGTSEVEEEVVALVGCRDGSIREFVLNTLLSSKSLSSTGAVDCGPYYVAGPCHRPRRVIQVTDGQQPILQLACPIASSSLANETMFEQNDGLLVYAISETRSLEASVTEINQERTKANKKNKKIAADKKKGEEEKEDNNKMDVEDEKNDQTKAGTPSSKSYKRVSVPPKRPAVKVALLRLVLPAPPTPDMKTNQKPRNEGTKTSFISIFPTDSDGQSEDEASPPRVQEVDQIVCLVGREKKGELINTLPFSLQAIARPSRASAKVADGTTNQCVFVMIARNTNLHIYYDPFVGPSAAGDTNHCRSVTLASSYRDLMSTALISSNKSDIACGHMSGTVFVMNNMLTIIEDYHFAMTNYERHFGANGTAKSREPDHPTKTVISSKMHWHAHPVSALAYDAASGMSASSMTVDPMLFSGGDESVLVTWQLSRNTNRPADVLPRIALGGIVHVAAVGSSADEGGAGGSMPNAILVHCEDNSLQLYESHNKVRLWKVQGLAAQDRPERPESSSTWPCMEADPRANTGTDPNQHELVLLGLPDAPGFMHWYNPRLQRVTGSLEVSPFNRISRQQQDESPMPAPAIVNHSLSASGNDLITVDEVMTENTFVGAFMSQENGPDYGVVTTIRFWMGNDASSAGGSGDSSARSAPYNQVASMTFPHGPKNRISAMAISPDGMFACTVSTDERSFRVWQKEGGPVLVKPDDDDARRRHESRNAQRQMVNPTWTCRYKVTTPCGFSNMATHRDAVAFSNDSSILAIGYGHFVTLWDTLETRLLTSVRHLEGCDGIVAAIDSVQFVNTNRSQDMLLVQSSRGISLQSPFGELSGPGLPRWSWEIPGFSKDLTVSSACLMPSHDCFAVSIHNRFRDRSSVVLIDAETGNLGLELESDATSKTSYIDGIAGRVLSIRAAGQRRVISKWGGGTEQDQSNPVCLYGLTSRGKLMSFTESGSSGRNRSITPAQAMPSRFHYQDELSEEEYGAPRLNVERRKRARTEPASFGATPGATAPTLGIFGSASRDHGALGPPPTSDLPALSGAFVRAFVGRNLARQGN